MWEEAWYGDEQCETYTDPANAGDEEKAKWPKCCGPTPPNFEDKAAPLVVKALEREKWPL